MKREKRQGFTLIELLVSVTLMLMLIGVVVSVFMQSSRVFTTAEAKMNIYQNARAAFGIMAREMASIDNSGDDFKIQGYSSESESILEFMTTTSWMNGTTRESGSAFVRYFIKKHSKRDLWRLTRVVENPKGTEVANSLLCEYIQYKYQAPPNDHLKDTSNTPNISLNYFYYDTSETGKWKNSAVTAAKVFVHSSATEADKTPVAVRLTMSLTDAQNRVTRTVSRVIWIATAGN